MDWQTLIDQPLLLAGGGLLAVVAVIVLVVLLGRRPVLPPIPVGEAPPAGQEDGVVTRLRQSLARTREALQGRFDELFRGRRIDEALFEELETTLLSADVGMPT